MTLPGSLVRMVVVQVCGCHRHSSPFPLPSRAKKIEEASLAPKLQEKKGAGDESVRADLRLQLSFYYIHSAFVVGIRLTLMKSAYFL